MATFALKTLMVVKCPVGICPPIVDIFYVGEAVKKVLFLVAGPLGRGGG